jgi:hypothetical protein
LTPRERRYIVWQSGVGSAIVNALINGALGWLGTRAMPNVPLWRVPGAAADLLGTAYGISFGTTLGTALLAPRDVRRGKIGAIAMSPGVAAFVARFPDRVLKRAVGLGILSMAFAVPLVAVLAAVDSGGLERMAYVEIKTWFAAFVGAAVTPFIVLRALSDVARKG